MNPSTALWIVVALVAGATICGLIQSRTALRVRKQSRAAERRVSRTDLGVDDQFAFGSKATLVQFSTQFCSKCPGTARLLSAEAQSLEGVSHVDIDLTDRTELAREFNILQTPTILVLDGSGVLRTRITGAPTVSVIRDELASLGALPYSIERSENVS